MKIFLDCLPCMLKQVLEASQIVTKDPILQANIMEESIKILSGYKNYRSSPELLQDMHRVVKRLTGIHDPYKEIKKRDINTGKDVYPMIKEFISNKDNKLYWALKASATGNIIDSAIIIIWIIGLLL